MSIEKALEKIESGEQAIPSNPLVNTGLSDAVTWDEVREWLRTLVAPDESTEALSRVSQLANDWHMCGESTMAYSKTVPDEHISMNLLTEGAAMVENARHIRNAIAGPETVRAEGVPVVASAWDEGYEVGLNHHFDATTQPRNPYNGAAK